MDLGLVINFKDGNKRTENQLHRLGIVVPDGAGDLWTYVQFAEDVVYGDVCRDSAGGDIITGAAGAISQDIDVGTNILVDAGEFATDDDKWLVGALGWIHVGAGVGTAFYVRRVRDDGNTLDIEILATATGRGGKGWPVVLLSATTRYSLYMPGLVRKGAGPDNVVRGVAQAPAKKGEYGFIKQTRMAAVRADASTAFVRNGGIRPAGVGATENGQVTPSGTAVAGQATRIGRWLFENIPGTAESDDTIAYVDLEINNDTVSYRFPDEEVALNRVEVA